MAALDTFVNEIDRLSRRLLRNLECCDRTLVAAVELTAAQAYSLLVLDERGPSTMTELSSEMRLHGTTMTRMVDGLVEKDLAERQADAEDRRVVRVHLTDRGREAVEEIQRAKTSFLAAAFSDLSDEERDAILKALRRFTDTAEQLGARCCCCR